MAIRGVAGLGAVYDPYRDALWAAVYFVASGRPDEGEPREERLLACRERRRAPG